MKEDDRQEFARVMAAVYSLYRLDLTRDLVQMWWAAIQHLEIEAVKGALNRHVMNPDSGQYPPKPADVIRELGGTSQDASLIAWAKAMDAVRHVGSYDTVVFDDPIIMRVIVDLGGWPAFCAGEERDNGIREKRFRDAYRAYRNRGMRDLDPILRLPGRVEIENSARGYAHEVPAPKLIGNKDRALAIMNGQHGNQFALILQRMDKGGQDGA